MELFAWKDKKILALKYYSGSFVELEGVGTGKGIGLKLELKNFNHQTNKCSCDNSKKKTHRVNDKRQSYFI